MNDYNQFFGNLPTPIIRANERDRLAFVLTSHACPNERNVSVQDIRQPDPFLYVWVLWSERTSSAGLPRWFER